MKTAAVITEYNPFHNGHMLQARLVKEKTGADYVVAIMSGDFVQRGAPAILDKYDKAACALSGGIDLVVELPVSFALGSADAFASAGAAIASAMGIDYLCFGCEEPDLGKLSAAAAVQEEEGNEFKSLLKEGLKAGLPFAAANGAALSHVLHEKDPSLFPSEEGAAEFIKQPNNILGIAYLRSLQALHSSTVPVALPRTGNAYHSLSLEGGNPSASAVRAGVWEAVSRGTALSEIPGLKEAVPAATFKALEKAMEEKRLQQADDYSSILFYLLEKETPESLQAKGIRKDLAARILSCRGEAASFSQLAGLVKNRSLTYASVSRTLMRLILELPFMGSPEGKKHSLPEDLKSSLYAHVLGLRKEARPLLSWFSKRGSIPLVTSLAGDVPRLSENQHTQISQGLSATRIYRDIEKAISGSPAIDEYRQKLLIM